METTVEEKAPGTLGAITVLTNETANTLHRMLSSKDKGDHTVAQLCLNQLDTENSIYYIWCLAKHHASKMVYLRTKASREFSSRCQLFTIAYKKDLEFAEWLVNKNWMTPVIYKKLEPEILKTLKHNHKNTFFDAYITIKDNFRDLDPENSLLNLSEL